MEQTTERKLWTCPHCQADLARDGLSEVTEGLNRWTVWRRHNGYWEFFDEDDQDDFRTKHLECRTCARQLAEPLARRIWDEVQASW